MGAQMWDADVVKIKTKLSINVSALWIAIVAERDARLASIAAASTARASAATSTRSQKRRAGDEGEQARGSKRKRVAEEAGAKV